MNYTVVIHRRIVAKLRGARRVSKTVRIPLLPFLDWWFAMTAAIVDRARLIRLCVFIREHQQQSRDAFDVDRMELWDNVLNKLVDHMPRSCSSH